MENLVSDLAQEVNGEVMPEVKLSQKEDDMNEGEEINSLEEVAVGGLVNEPLQISGDMVGDFVNAEFGDEVGKVTYLQNERSLQLPVLSADSINQDAPFDSLQTIGNWLKEAANLKNYWLAVERFGEDIAKYKWAYDEGELGDFDAKKIAIEAGKAGLRSVGGNLLRTSGNLMNMFGTNMANGSAMTTFATAGAGAVFPKAGEEIAEIGRTLRDYADVVENFEVLAPSVDMASNDPSWTRLANVMGGGVSQVLAMGMTAKLLGGGAAYGLFAMGGAGEMFSEAYEQSGDVGKANVLAGANAGVTFAIDKMFNPLPEMVQKNAKATSKMIAKEMLGAPLREAGSEVLQQMLAENLVRKVGIDDTQDLFEGMIESALGAFAGSTVLTTASGGAYFAQKNYEDARRRILLKGVTAEELDLYQKNMMKMMESKPEAFEKILSFNLKENLRALDKEARKVKNKRERKAKLDNLDGFQKVYDTMYERFLSVLGDETKAKAAAGIFEAGAMSMYEQDNSFTPDKIAENLLPTLQKTSVGDFLAKALAPSEVSFQIIGPRAKKADHDKLALALDLEKRGVDQQGIWRMTGWVRGADGGMHSEISDAGAKIKLWDNDSDEEASLQYMKTEKANLENMRAYLAAGVDASANGIYGDYYKAFIKYLDSQKGNEGIFDPLNSADDEFEIISPEVLMERESEDFYLGALAASMNHADGEGMQAKFWQKLRNDYLKNAEDYLHDDSMLEYHELSQEEVAKLKPQDHGFIYRDFQNSDQKIIMAIMDMRRFDDFKKRYWNSKKGPNSLFLELAAQKEAEYGDNPKYVELMDRITLEAKERRDERVKEINKKGLGKHPQLFQDIDLEEAYRRYVAYLGDFSGEIIDRGYRGGGYENAYRTLTSSEHFLDQEQFSYFNETEKKALLEHLDRVELLYRIDKHLARSEAYEKRASELRNRLAKKTLEEGGMSRATAEIWRARLQLKNGMEMKLGDILDHEALYDNYPDMPDVVVRFAKLKEGESSHFYHDRGRGYVLEYDADKLNFANLKEELIRGTTFVVQDLEGFDFVLTDKQRKNYMDRQIYIARKATGEEAVKNMRDFVRMALPGVNPNIFVMRKNMPVTLAGLAESFDVKHEGPDMESATYKEVDYDKLTDALVAKYRMVDTPEGLYVRDYMYANLQRLKTVDTMRVMAMARQNGGYRSAELPWSGVTAQGAMDARAAAQRANLSAEELRRVPYFDNNNDLRYYVADTMDAFSEFELQYRRDRKAYSKTLENLAQGAFDSANNIIFLFEKADASTIVHETFHSFWNMMEQFSNKNESHGIEFQMVMNDLREEVLVNYRIQRGETGYYVIDKLNGEVLEELPRKFNTSDEALDAAVRELFVTHFMAIFNGKTVTKEGNSIADAADFYRKWLETIALKLELYKGKVGKDGKKLLQFIKKKIK